MDTVTYGFRGQAGRAWAKPLADAWREWHEVLDGREPLAPSVFVRLGQHRDGRLIVTGVLVGGFDGLEVTARSLRTIPLGQVAAATAEYLAGHVGGSPLGRALTKAMAEQLLAAPARPARARVRPGPKGYSPDFYVDVADRYKAALIQAPARPMKHLAEEMSFSEAQMRRHVQRARDMGLLGTALPGRAGSIEEEEA
jgi:hypothetical protein